MREENHCINTKFKLCKTLLALLAHSGLLGVARGHSGLLGVARGCSGSLGVTRGHSGSLGVTRGGSGSLGGTRGSLGGHSGSLGVTRGIGHTMADQSGGGMVTDDVRLLLNEVSNGATLKTGLATTTRQQRATRIAFITVVTLLLLAGAAVGVYMYVVRPARQDNASA